MKKTMPGMASLIIFIFVLIVALAKVSMTDITKIDMPPLIVALIWTVIFLQIAGSLIIIYNSRHEKKNYIINLFSINMLFNLGWTFYFHAANSMFAAFITWTAYWISTYMLLGECSKFHIKLCKIIAGYLMWITIVGIFNLLYI